MHENPFLDSIFNKLTFGKYSLRLLFRIKLFFIKMSFLRLIIEIQTVKFTKIEDILFKRVKIYNIVTAL